MLEMVRRNTPTLDRVVAILDVDGDSVGVVLAHVIPKMPLAILGEKRVRLPASDRTLEHSAARLADILENSSLELLNSIRGMSYVVDTAYIVLRMPWVSTRLVRRAVYSGKEVPVTREFINTVAMNAISGDIVPSQEDYLEGRVMRVELNGYPTNDPLGKRAHTVDLTLLVSESPKREREIVKAAVQRTFPVAHVEWRSGTRAMAHAMRTRAQAEKEYLFVDVGPESSQLTLVSDGVITAHETVPFGLRAFVSGGEVSEDIIRDSLLAHRDARHAPSLDAAVRAHMARKGEDAVAAFAPALAAVSHGRSIPDRVHALAPQESQVWLSHVFDRPECSQLKHSHGPIHMLPVNAASFAPVFHTSDAVQDPSLALACALVHNECDNG